MRHKCTPLLAVLLLLFGGFPAAFADTVRYVGVPSPINFAESAHSPEWHPPHPFLQPPVIGLAAPSREWTPRQVTELSIVRVLGQPSPAPSQNFPGQDGRLSIPDTMGTVGTQHVMSTLNDGFRVQDRSGVVLSTMDDEVFWSSAGTSLYHYDPRVLYDGYAGRWIIVEAYRDQVRNLAGVSVAVSRTHDPTGVWDRYAFAAAPGDWIDYPMAAFNQSSITLAMNSVSPDGSGRNVIYVIDKVGLYAGGGFSYDYATRVGDVMTPVTVYGDAVGISYFIERVSGANSVRLWRVSSGTLVQIATTMAPLPWSENTPLLPQLGSAVRISPEDTRITNALLRNGALWFTQTVFLPPSQATRAAVQWWKLSTTGQLLDFGRIDDPSGDISSCFPAIAVNAKNDVVLGFTQFSANSYPAAAYAVRSGLDPGGTFRAPFIVKSGEGPYEDGRWGDYSATVPDPDDATFWTLQEYAAFPSGGAHWGVWWAHIPAPQAPVVGKRRAAHH